MPWLSADAKEVAKRAVELIHALARIGDVEHCQECGLGQTQEWRTLKRVVASYLETFHVMNPTGVETPVDEKEIGEYMKEYGKRTWREFKCEKCGEVVNVFSGDTMYLTSTTFPDCPQKEGSDEF